MKNKYLSLLGIFFLAAILCIAGIYIYDTKEVVVLEKNTTFIYAHGQHQLIDINNDNIPDFKCLSRPAGNRFHQLIIPLNHKNKIIKSNDIMTEQEIVDHQVIFSDQFNFNDLGNGQKANIDNKYIAVKFQIKNRSHYGWIKFSSKVKGKTSNNTPIYYQNIVFHIEETAFNKHNDKPLKTI